MNADVRMERIAVREGEVTYAIVDVDRLCLMGEPWCEEATAVYERMVEAFLAGVRRHLLPRLAAAYADAVGEGTRYTYRPMRIAYRVACEPPQEGAPSEEIEADGEMRVTRTVTTTEAREAPHAVWSAVDRIRLRDGLFLA